MRISCCKIVEAILRKRKCLIFFGAGLSRSSGIPTVNDFLDEFCKVLKFDHYDDLRRIPFENLMSQLRSASDPHRLFHHLYEMFDVGKPNQNHYFLAALAAQETVKYFVTTNFDRHLERALRQSSCNFAKLYDKNGLRNIQSLPDSITLFKLHGSIESPETIDITLESISNLAQKEVVAAPLRLLFDSKDTEHVLFLGYSRSDAFDIEPVIKSHFDTNIKFVTWLHSSDDPRDPTVKSDELDLFGKEGACELVLRGNTDILITYLCEAFSIPNNESHQDLYSWKDILESWWLSLSRPSQLTVLAGLCATLGKVTDSLHLYSAAFNGATPDGGDLADMPSTACNIGIRLNSLERYEDALHYFNFAIDMCKEHSMPVDRWPIPSGRSTLLTAMLEKYDSLVGLKRYDDAGKHLFEFWHVLRGSTIIAPLPFKNTVDPFEPEAHYWAAFLLNNSHLFRRIATNEPSINEKKKLLTAAFDSSLAAIEIAEKGGNLPTLLAAFINHIYLLVQLSTEGNAESLMNTAREYYSKALELNAVVQPFTSEGRNTSLSLSVIGYRLYSWKDDVKSGCDSSA